MKKEIGSTFGEISAKNLFSGVGAKVNAHDGSAQKQDKLDRLHRAIEDGIVDLEVDLKSGIQDLKNERDLAKASLDRIAEQTRVRPGLAPERIEPFLT